MTPTPSHAEREAFAARVRAITDGLATMLIEKNVAYGNSALDPVRIFSKADPVEQLRVRIDDKLSRLVRGAAAGEDVVWDLLGYLVLLRMAEASQCSSSAFEAILRAARKDGKPWVRSEQEIDALRGAVDRARCAVPAPSRVIDDEAL